MTRPPHPLSRLLLAAAVAALTLSAGCSEPTADQLLASAHSHLAKNEPDAARLQLKTLLQGTPKSGEARFLLGKLLVDSGELPAAEAELRRALEARHPDNAVLPLLAQVMLAMGQTQQLLSQFGQTQLSEAAADAELKTHLAAAHATEGRMDQAQALIDKALTLQPGFVPAVLLQAKLQAATNAPDAAMKTLEQLLQQKPDSAQAWAQKGDLLALLNGPTDADAAMAAWRKSLALRPANVAVHAAVLTRLVSKPDIPAATAQLAELKKFAPNHPQAMLFDAVLSSQRGEHAQTRELTQQLLRMTPNSVQALLLAGHAELSLGAVAKAENHFGRAMQLAPKASLPRRMMAQVQLSAGQADKALASLRPVMDHTPVDPEVLYLAARAHLTKGDSKAAEQLFERAAKRQPDDPRARTALALGQLGKGQEGQAFTELKAIAQTHNSTVADLALINARLSRNELPAALEAAQALAVKIPHDALPDQLMGRIALQRREPAVARKHFEQALSKNADYLPALAGLASLDLEDKKPKVAAERFEAVLGRHPQHGGAMMALAELSSRSGDNAQATKWLDKAILAEPGDPKPRMMLVDMQMSNQQPRQALDSARAALAAVPGHVELLDRLGRAQLLNGDHAGAVQSFTQLASQLPRSALPQLRLADAHFAAGDKAATAASVGKAQAVAPHDPLVLQALANLAVQQNKPPQALAAARALQTRLPDDGLGHVIEGDLALRQKQWDSAVAAYRKGAAKPKPGDAPLRLQTALVLAGKLDEADRLGIAWQKSHPEDMRYVLHRGDLALSGERHALAEQQYRAVLAKMPEHVLALNNLAYLLALQQKPGAVALAEQALKGAPNAPAVMDTLAFSLATERQLERAISLQTQAVALAPNAPNYRLRLAKLHLQAGDAASARAELRTLAKLGPAYNRQAEVSSLLKANGG